MTPKELDQLRQRIEARPHRTLRFEIGAPLDAAIAASTPNAYQTTGGYNREYTEQGIYLINDQIQALFPPSVYREVTPMVGMGSMFSSENVNGPIQPVYGLGDQTITFPLSWNVNGGLHAGHFYDFDAWTYLVPMPLYEALDQLRAMIQSIERAGWRATPEGFVTIEEAAVLMRAAELSGQPLKGFGVGSYINASNTASCGFGIKLVTSGKHPPSTWGYGCNVGFIGTETLRDKLYYIAKTARKQLRFKNYLGVIQRKNPEAFSGHVQYDIWTSTDSNVPAEVELYDYLRQIRQAGLTRDLDPRWAR